jgi:hypothetical protein
MSPTVPLSGVARARTLFFLEHRMSWPMWPFLPLVRRRPGCEEELGVLFDSFNAGGPPGFGSTVFLANMFLLPRRLEEFLALPKEVFDLPEELADAGWCVDGD